MKRLNMKVLMATFFVIALCTHTKLWGQDSVKVKTAGSLSTLLKETTTNAAISGQINGTDVKYLRQLITEKSLTSLDLSQAQIVSGGDAYYETNTTTKDKIGNYMFFQCSKLQTIILPQGITYIGSNAFARTGLKSIEIPNSVSHLGMDAFAYCSSLTKVVLGKSVSQLDQGVFYSSGVKNLYMKPLNPPTATASYILSSKPTIRVYNNLVATYKATNWNNLGTIVGGLDALYPLEPDSTEMVKSALGTFFEDAACTTLKAEYSSMTDEALTAALKEAGSTAFFIEIALKIKNQNWKNYEKDFRIHSYKAYSDAYYWNNKLHSSGGSYMGNPTGIYADETEPMYVFVDQDIPADATLYLAPCVDNALISSAKTGTKLEKGLNIIDGVKNALYYVVYTADTKSETKKLSEWPEIKIHIEGGVVNGYYDLSRHSDKDYVAILAGATHELFTVRGAESLFNFRTSTYREVFPKTIDKSICWFDSLTVWQKELMGICESVANGQRNFAPHYLTGGEGYFPSYYNNPNFAIEGNSSSAGYANSSTYRTCYNSVGCISRSFDVSRSDHDDWCVAHECGHNNQKSIKLEGGTEVSNNLFSNVIRFLYGRITSNGLAVSDEMNDWAKHTPFNVRDISSQMRMYYQLYLYYHQAQKNTSFYPELFKALREDPMVLFQTGSYNSNLKFVRKVCQVAQEDLTDFFRAWGFFEPCSVTISDYGTNKMVVAKDAIDRTLAEIAQYPKKNREILFIEDRADYVPTRSYLTTGGQHRRDADQVGKCANMGQFTDYLPGANKPSEYTYLQADSLYAMEGTGGIGFVMLDADDNLVYAANTKRFCVPKSVGEFTIWSMDADGSLHPTTLSGSGAANIKVPRAGVLPDSLNASMLQATVSGRLNGTDLKYMRQLVENRNLSCLDLSNAQITSGGYAYYLSYYASNNVMGQYLFSDCSQLVNIQLPKTITSIGSNAFARTGIRSVVIPDKVTTVGGDAFAYCPSLSTVVIGEKVKTMQQGIFYQSNVKDAYVKATTPPTVSSYLFSSKPVIHVYASSLAAYKASAWADYGTIIGDLDKYPEITAIHEVVSDTKVDKNDEVYDLFGNRVTTLQKGNIYVNKGQKILCK